MTTLTVGKLLSEKREFFEFFPLLEDIGYEKNLTNSLTHRPGLALSGYMGYYLWERVQIIGITETGYLETLAPDQRREAVNRITSFELPCIIVTKGLPVQPDLVTIAAERGIPVLRTDLDGWVAVAVKDGQVIRIISP